MKLRHAIMPTSNLEMRLQKTPSHNDGFEIANASGTTVLLLPSKLPSYQI